jgi:hypothetical protein
MELPLKIIVETQDGEYIVATYLTTKENADEEDIPVYRYKEYYHNLESAIRDEF